MCHALIQSSKFCLLLVSIDQERAEETRAGGCPCGGVLHRADYPRKPRGCPDEMREQFESRFSFCCNRCRCRITAGSVRFLGRRVYLGLVVVLASARHAGQMPAASELCALLGVSVRTLMRWRCWWREAFVRTALWRQLHAGFMPPVSSDAIPGILLERLTGNGEAKLSSLLKLLGPLGVRRIALREGR